MIQNVFELSVNLGPHDIVIANLDSTPSGTAVGWNKNKKQPYTSLYEGLDENWTLWLDLCSKAKNFGNRYCFYCRQIESMMESFTITTEDVTLFNHWISISGSSSTVGTILLLRESRCNLNLYTDTAGIWGPVALCARTLGLCTLTWNSWRLHQEADDPSSGADITAEMMCHLKFPPRSILQRILTIPRIMPRMSSILLAHSCDERPNPINPEISNIGLVGEFVEIPEYSCIDMSYGLRAAKTVVSRLTGVNIPNLERKRSLTGLLLRIFLWK